MTATEVLREEVRQYIDHADDTSLRRVKAAIVEIEQGDEDTDEDMEDEDWDDLPKELQVLLDRAIKEGEEGKVISHEEVVAKYYPKWFRQ